MEFLNREEELRRLDHALQRRGFAVLWGRRRVGKSRLLLEWCRRCDGTYTVADRSVPAVQRRYLAIAMAERFPGFDAVEYPNWRSFFDRVGAEAVRVNWHGPLVLDELPYLIAADATLPGVLQNWIDAMTGRLCVVVSGSSVRMMHGAVLDAGAPLYGRAVEAFAVRPLRPGWLAAVFGAGAPRELVSLYALLGGLPRYWELAEGLGAAANQPAIRNGRLADALVLDPRSPLHNEPERLLLGETPPAAALRPLLDAVGSGRGRIWRLRRGNSCAVWRFPRCTVTTLRWGAWGLGNRRNAIGVAVGRKSMSWRVRRTVGGCFSAKPNGPLPGTSPRRPDPAPRLGPCRGREAAR